MTTTDRGRSPHTKEEAMRTSTLVAKPPSVAGVADATVGDHLRALVWLRRNHVRLWREKRILRSGVLAVLWWLALPITVPFAASRPWRRRVRYYATPHAQLAIAAKPGGIWVLQDHIASKMRKGYGRDLRDALLEPVLALVDDLGITVKADTRSEKLATEYLRDLPGATMVRRPNGMFEIRRAPQHP